MLEELFGETENLAFITLFAGLAIGWAIQWFLDSVFWRRKRVCTKVEEKLESANRDLVAENQGLRDRAGQCAECETRVVELEAAVTSRDELVVRLQGQIAEGTIPHYQPLDVSAIVDQVAGRLEITNTATLETFRSELVTVNSLAQPAPGANAEAQPVHCDADVDVIVERLSEQLRVVNSTTIHEVSEVVHGRYDDMEKRLFPNGEHTNGGLPTPIGTHAAPGGLLPPQRPGSEVHDDHPQSSEERSTTESVDNNDPVTQALIRDKELRTPLGSPHNRLYRIDHQWSPDQDWRDAGAWVLSSRDGQTIQSLQCSADSSSEGFVGSVTYEGMPPVDIQAVKTGHNTYEVVEQRNDGSASEETATWLLGARWDHDLVELQLEFEDGGEGMHGVCRYEGEAQLGVRGQAVDASLYLVDSDRSSEVSFWVLGATADRPFRVIRVVSENDGETFIGTCSFDGSSSLDLRCARWAGNTYHAETREPDSGPWEDAGLWVLGSSGDHNLLDVELASTPDGGLAGLVSAEGGRVALIRCRPAKTAPARIDALGLVGATAGAAVGSESVGGTE